MIIYVLFANNCQLSDPHLYFPKARVYVWC